MADQSDVEIALAALCGGVLYPSGPSGSPITGDRCRVYRGFPNSKQLDADLLANIAHVSIYEQAGFSRLTGGYVDEPPIEVRGIPTVTATVSGNTVTIGGTPALGQLLGVVINGRSYAYPCKANDTPTTVAAGMVAVYNLGSDYITDFRGFELEWLITGVSDGTATSSGPIITFPTTGTVIARVAAQGTVQTRPRWQVGGFRITIWAPTPAARDRIASLLDANLANTPRISLPDGQGARLEWRNTFSDDVPQKEQMWKRDLFYTVQYATSIITSVTPVLLTFQEIYGSQRASLTF